MFRLINILGIWILGYASIFATFGTCANAADFKVLYAFKGGGADGALPWSGLQPDGRGNFLGTTYAGGAGGKGCRGGCGTVYEITKDGSETVLYSFTGKSGNGAMVPPTIGKHGRLYGTTYGGGKYGFGTVYTLSAGGKEKVLHSFTGGTDGANPGGDTGLILDKAGNVYGTTGMGGASGGGTVFEIAPNGTETVLHSFVGGADGFLASGTLLADGSGNLYGTTSEGGEGYEGTVYKVAPNGDETIVYSFSQENGWSPNNNLILDSQGNLYGVTFSGGFGVGIVFKIAPNGTETDLHSFAGGSDGRYPSSGLLMDGAANLYGTTGSGGNGGCAGNEGCGTVYKLAPDGTETLLHVFSGSDGEYPSGTLTADGKGNLYGTASEGGPNGYGVVFVVKE